MSGAPTSFRFENEEMQRELCARLKALRIEVTEQPDGTLIFRQDQRGDINSEAHQVPDRRFGLWRFLNFSPEEYLRRQIDLMRTHKIPHELEYHGTRLVLLLPRDLSDEHRKLLTLPDVPD